MVEMAHLTALHIMLATVCFFSHSEELLNNEMLPDMNSTKPKQGKLTAREKLEEKAKLEEKYQKSDPWNYIGSSTDLIRRKIFLWHLEYAFNHLPIKDVLDAGCGEGDMTHDLAEAHDDIHIDAFDISENAIRFAEQRNSAENIDYFSVDVRDFQPKKKYDLILCEEALCYFNDTEKKLVLGKFHDALKDNAFLKLSMISIGWYVDWYYFTVEEVRNLLPENGFEIISIYPTTLLRDRFIYRLLLRGLNRLYIITKLDFILELAARFTRRSSLERAKHISVLSKKC
jgi:2-polyprenyl-3-methyl-5-hydroxy-6-metoxy-1,4-benzoquinol methylase